MIPLNTTRYHVILKSTIYFAQYTGNIVVFNQSMSSLWVQSLFRQIKVHCCIIIITYNLLTRNFFFQILTIPYLHQCPYLHQSLIYTNVLVKTRKITDFSPNPYHFTKTFSHNILAFTAFFCFISLKIRTRYS